MRGAEWSLPITSAHLSTVDADGLVHLNDLQQHLKISSPTLWKAFHALATLHVRKGTRVSFFSATPSGGGVALMRHALVRLWRECGGNVIWNVPMGDPAVFQITKYVAGAVVEQRNATR